MTFDGRIVGLVPARAGSKGLPGKNLLPYKGVPLVVHAGLVGAEALADGVWLSTDDLDAARAWLEHDCGERINRPSFLSTDDASMRDVVMHFAAHLDLSVDDAICVLYPTYPTRTAQLIRDAVSCFCVHGLHDRPMMGVQKPLTHPYRCVEIRDKTNLLSVAMGWSSLEDDIVLDRGIARRFGRSEVYRRQDSPPAWELTCVVCIIPVSSFPRLDHNLLAPDTYAYEVERHPDIDTAEDLEALR